MKGGDAVLEQLAGIATNLNEAGERLSGIEKRTGGSAYEPTELFDLARFRPPADPSTNGHSG